MTEAVKSNEVLNALDPSKRVGKRDTNNLAAADQIQFSTQFSSILRTLVDTPEQMMDAAAGPAEPKVLDRRGEDRPEREVRGTKQAERRREPRKEFGGETQRQEPRIERPQPFESVRSTQRDDAPEETSSDTATASAENTTAQTAAPTADKTFRDQVVAAPKAIVEPTEGQTARPTADQMRQVAPTETAADIEHAAQSIAAGALTNRQFARVGEDLHDAVEVPSTNAGSHTGAQTAANSLKDEQASDLANRLGNVGAVSVHVDTGNQKTKSPSTPLAGLGAGVDFGKFEGLDVIDPAAGPFQGDGDGMGTDQKAAASHGNVPVDRAGGTTPQDIANTFSQALRAQAAVMGTQQAANQGADGKAQMAPAETIQGIGAANGPNQVSQSAKAAPAAPPRQPEKPQTPAEQIAVKIRQAIGDGADKINIKLNPHELGRVEVRLELAKDGGIVATVLAERQETLDMLQKDARGLERALNDAGLRTDSASLTFGLRGDGQKTVDGGRDRRNAPQGREDRVNSKHEFGEDTGPLKAGNYGRTSRANGGVDIRV